MQQTGIDIRSLPEVYGFKHFSHLDYFSKWSEAKPIKDKSASTIAQFLYEVICHPQSNGLCERQNKTIKDSLVKVLDENPCDWPNIIEEVLFAHRVSKHTSINFIHSFLCIIGSLLYQSMSSIV